MPASGSVYQPTTTTIAGGSDGLKRGGSAAVWKRIRYVLMLVCGIFCMALGIGLLASGTAAFLSPTTPNTFGTNSHVATGEGDCYPVGMTVAGAITIIIAIIALTIYFKKSNWRRDIVCPCSTLFDKKQSFARQLQSGGVCGQNLMNPSSDPLVSHPQYAPVSELPSLRVDDEERRNLMPDSKDCLSSAEESDRMIEPDPRIVLRPMGHVEDA